MRCTSIWYDQVMHSEFTENPTPEVVMGESRSIVSAAASPATRSNVRERSFTTGSFSDTISVSPLDFFFSGDLMGVLLADAVGTTAGTTGSRGLTFSPTAAPPCATDVAVVNPTLDGVAIGLDFPCC